VGHADPELAVAAVSGRIGGHRRLCWRRYRPALDTMQQVLTAGKAVKQSLLELPVSLSPAADGPAGNAWTVLPPPLRWLRIFSLSTPTEWKATISVGAASPSPTCDR